MQTPFKQQDVLCYCFKGNNFDGGIQKCSNPVCGKLGTKCQCEEQGIKGQFSATAQVSIEHETDS